MIERDEREALRILELPPNASQEDIRRAYHLLRRLHGRDGAVFAAPGMEEFSGEARQAVLQQIDAAYALLSALAPEAPPAPPGARPETGTSALQQARAAAGLTLEQVAAETHVRIEYLSALEEERFEQLRLATVNVRGYLTAYLNAIGLAAEDAVPPYMKKFLAWQATQGR
ncbi:MAG: helix-turn-helix domain-containing protein [Holophaga sp.]|nr:helix-turn-helix domain-containing protein [Holophaga sp.]